MSHETLISAQDHWALWAVLLAAAALGLWAERTRWGARLSAVVVTMLATVLLSNLSVIPTSAPAYDVVWSYLVPLAIPLLLLRADLRRILREAGPTLLAFAAGAAGTILGTVIAFYAVPLGPESWKLASIFCATYVGGSMNFVAAAESVGLHRGDLLTAGVAADNLVMALYFLTLLALPSVALLRRHYTRDRAVEATAAAEMAAPQPLLLVDATTGLALAAVLCACGFGLEKLVGIDGAGILILTALTVIAASTFPRALQRISGAERLGVLLMQVFFAVIGASANVHTVIRVGPRLFLLAAVILTVHLLFVLLAGLVLRLDLRELVIASNANIGGPTTAAAMAAARRWEHLVIPAILVGTLGYAVATFLGVAVGHVLR